MLGLLFRAATFVGAKVLPKAAATGVKKAAPKIATAGKTAAKTATTTGKAALSQTDKMAINSVKFSKVLALGVGATAGIEIYSGGIIATNATKATIELERWLREQNLPSAADFMKENGLAAFSMLGSIKDLPRDTLTRMSATYLDMKGMPEEANAARILNSITKPMSAIITVAGAEKGQQAQEYTNWLIEDSGVAKEKIVAFLQKNPGIVSKLKDNPIQSVDLTTQFPALKQTTAAPVLTGVTLANTDKITTAAKSAFTDIKENASTSITNRFNAMVINALIGVLNIVTFGLFKNHLEDWGKGLLTSQTAENTTPVSALDIGMPEPEPEIS